MRFKAYEGERYFFFIFTAVKSDEGGTFSSFFVVVGNYGNV
jgi:hypothetical protein